MTEDLHENHHGDLADVDHLEDVFNHFSVWITVPSVTTLVCVIILGGLANAFMVCIILKKKIGTPVINPILLTGAIKNLLAIGTCIPTAIAMLCVPARILKTTCYIQENITFIVLFGGFLYPALLSGVQCDQTRLPFGKRRKLMTIRILIVMVTTLTVVIGIQGIMNTTDDHGCHMWSRRVDDVVMTYIYSIGIVAILCFVVMGTSYFLIYRQAADHENILRTRTNNSGQDAGTTRGGTTRGGTTRGGTTRGGTTKVNNPLESTSARTDTQGRRKTTTSILKPMFCIVITNLMFSLPWQVLYGLTITGNLSANLHDLRVLAMCILYLPIATDPVIFIMFSTKGKNAVKSLCRSSTVTPAPLESVSRLSTSVPTPRK